jgi:hypothetical protein
MQRGRFRPAYQALSFYWLVPGLVGTLEAVVLEVMVEAAGR